MEHGKRKDIFEKIKGISISRNAKLLFSVIVLAIVFNAIGIEKVIGSLKDFNFLVLFWMIIIFALILMINAINLFILTKNIGDVKFSEVFHYSYVAWAIGFVLPGKLGDFSYGSMLKKNGFSLGEGIAIVTMDKALTLLIILAISTIGILFLINSELNNTVIFLILLWAGIIIAAFEFGLGLAEKYLPEKISQQFVKFSKPLKKVYSNKVSLLLNFSLTILRIILQTLVFYFILNGFGLGIDFFTLIFIVTIGTIVSLIPITFSGLGFREGMFIYLLGLQGIPIEIAGSAALISVLFDYSIAGLIILKESMK
ncbi:MAG: flippase-like domain-containing protein [archaeon]|nr:flippase-like domain-containing protein [archaeon]